MDGKGRTIARRMQFVCVCSSLPILCINSVSKCNLQQLENNCMLNMCIAGPGPRSFHIFNLITFLNLQHWNKFSDPTNSMFYEKSSGYFNTAHKLRSGTLECIQCLLFYIVIHWFIIFMWCFIWYFLLGLCCAVLASASISRIDIK